MNDFQMTHLAADRLSEYRADADRQRLARVARQASPRRPERKASGQRRGLGLLLGRVALY